MIELNDDPTVEELIEESIQAGTYPFRLRTRAEKKELLRKLENGDPKTSLIARFMQLDKEEGVTE